MEGGRGVGGLLGVWAAAGGPERAVGSGVRAGSVGGWEPAGSVGVSFGWAVRGVPWRTDPARVGGTAGLSGGGTVGGVGLGVVGAIVVARVAGAWVVGVVTGLRTMADDKKKPGEGKHGTLREGAGLEEARINQDFVNFLTRWGPYVLLGIAAVILGYRGLQFLEQREQQKVNEAFAEYSAAGETTAPDITALTRVASAYEDVRGVPHLARLRAAQVSLSAFRRGLQPNAQVGADGAPLSEDDVLDEDTRASYLSRAGDLFAQVVADTRDNPMQALMTLEGLFGMAAVRESQGDVEAASAAYAEAAAVASARLYPSLEALANRLKSGLESGLRRAGDLPSREALPPLPEFELPGGEGDVEDSIRISPSLTLPEGGGSGLPALPGSGEPAGGSGGGEPPAQGGGGGAPPAGNGG